MTALVTPADAASAGEHPLRIPPIAANLLPVEIVRDRRTRKVKRIVLSVIAVFSVLLAAWSGLASYHTSVERERLTQVEAGEQRLVQQQRAFAELISTQGQSAAISTRLAALLANDLQWSHLLSALQAAAPDGVEITGVSGILTAAATGASATGTAASGPARGGSQLPNTAPAKPIGTLTVTGTGTSRAAVASYVDALGQVDGLANALLGGATVESGLLQFTVQLDITSAALGGRYTPKSTEKRGG